MSKHTEQGGIFFYILLAIILLAGLTYTVSQNNRGNTELLTDEQARVAATEIIEYGNTVAAAVQKLRLRGCSDIEISFENNSSSDDYTNSNAPSDQSCHVFNIAGGNINYVFVPNQALDNSLSSNAAYGEYRFKRTGVESVGTIENELFIHIANLDETVCLKINDLLSISNPSEQPPTEMHSASPNFTGIYGSPQPDTIGDDGGHDIEGKLNFCRNNGGNYKYLHVLIAR